MDTIVKDEHCFCSSSTDSVWAKQDREPGASGGAFQGVTASVPDFRRFSIVSCAVQKRNFRGRSDNSHAFRIVLLSIV